MEFCGKRLEWVCSIAALHFIFTPVAELAIRLPELYRAVELTAWDSRADDLIPEENDTVQTAIKRLPAKEAYDRVFRIRRAFQVRYCPAALNRYPNEVQGISRI